MGTKSVLLNWGPFCLLAGTGQCLETLLLVTPGGGGAPDIWWVEAREAAKYPTMHRSVPTPTHPPTKNYMALNVSGAKVENPWLR